MNSATPGSLDAILINGQIHTKCYQNYLNDEGHLTSQSFSKLYHCCFSEVEPEGIAVFCIFLTFEVTLSATAKQSNDKMNRTPSKIGRLMLPANGTKKSISPIGRATPRNNFLL